MRATIFYSRSTAGLGASVMVIDGYIRVSRVGGRGGEQFISPAVQREQIEGWARRENVLVAYMFEELDESGARADRPLLGQAISRVESGDSDGVAVAYLSRFGRSLVDGVTAIDRITKAGGTFISVQDGLDFASDTGRLVLRLLLSIAEWELDRSRANWATARRRAVARGVYPWTPPYGYRRGSDRRLEVDAQKGPVVAELFRRRAQGAALVDLRRWLTEAGVPTATGRSTWNDLAKLRTVFRCRVYLGEAHQGSFVNPDAHPAIVDHDTWQLAQRKERRHWERGPQHPGLLSGLLRCSSCQRLMWTGRSAPGTSAMKRLYHCPRSSAAPTCPQPAVISDSVVEPYVEAVFWQSFADPRVRPLVRLEAAVERREQELAEYRDNARLPATIGRERFAAGLGVRIRRVDEARLELSRARVTERDAPTYFELRERWPSMTLVEKRARIEEVIECVFVEPGSRSPKERLHVCLRGQAPTGLPGFLGPHLTTRPFDPESNPAGPTMREERGWDEKEVREALEPFLAGRSQWPSFPEFQAAGLAIAYLHVQRHGGERRWADLTGLPYQPHRPDDLTDDRIRRELSVYLRGRAVWPAVSEFKKDGRRGLRNAITYAGGPDRWAPEMGVTLPLRNRNRPTKRWSYERMKSEMAPFAAGRKEWPAAVEFRAAGLGLLHGAIRRHHAREQLATELGLTLPPHGRVVRTRWTEPEVRATLDVFLKDRLAWPARSEFEEAGLMGLRNRLTESGAQERWQRLYGLAPPIGRAAARQRTRVATAPRAPLGD